MTDRYQLHNGDCLTVMRGMAADSCDSIVTDPPYGLAFMGKAWDKAVPGPEFFIEMLRVAKPGAYLLAFGGTRLYHRMAVAIEDAGWEIRDCLCWLYGSGFPKSLDVSKAIDVHLGASGERTFRCKNPADRPYTHEVGETSTGWQSPPRPDKTNPATLEAKQWDGWGTALKPAWEPIILARKPLIGTVAANVLAHGTGGINVDGCRVGTSSTPRKDPNNGNLVSAHMEIRPWMKERIAQGLPLKGDFDGDQGRWPANLVLDPVAAAMLDEQSGFLHSQGKTSPVTVKPGKRGVSTNMLDGGTKHVTYDFERYKDGGGGGASRFFYCAKADSTDRNEGLEGMEAVQVDESRDPDAPWGNNPRNRGAGERTNFHPTVKSTDLMRWLVRLVTPPGGVVLDCFMGSGSTGKAAMLEANRFIGIELDPGYFAIAERRIKHAAAQKRMF